MSKAITVVGLLFSVFSLSVEVNEPDLYGNLPLGIAASRGDFEECKRLIDLGANVHASDNAGKTPLHWAAYWGHTRVVNLLVTKKALIDSLDNENRTPLHFAAAEGHEKICELLVAQGADVNKVSLFDGTPLELARRANADGSHQSVIKCLLNNPGSIDKPSSRPPTRHPNHCGSFNGTRCFAEPGKVVWSLSSQAFRYFNPSRGCKALYDSADTWSCEWQEKDPVSIVLATAPCIDFFAGNAWTGSLGLDLNLLGHPPTDDIRGDYPAIRLHIELFTENTDAPIAEKVIDLANEPHQDWRWQFSNNFSISTSSKNLPEKLRCVHLKVWVSNRLKRSDITGAFLIRHAQLSVAYEHPKSESVSPPKNGLIRLRENLVSCEDSRGPHLTGCRLQEGKLKGSLPKYPSKTILRIDYVHTCSGTPLLVGIVFGNNRTEFISDGSQNSVEIMGEGPVIFRDFNGPEYTSHAVLVNPCTIQISGFRVRSDSEIEVEDDL